MAANIIGTDNTAIGNYALCTNTCGNHTAVGSLALSANTTGTLNTAVGSCSLTLNTTGSCNTAIGGKSLQANTIACYNTAVGTCSLFSNTTGAGNTAVGFLALSTSTVYVNTAGVGCNAQVTATNQIQLGDASTTTYVYGTVQNRSDLRDKTDIRDTILGLDFILALKPRDFVWDLREFYKPERPSIEEPVVPIAPPLLPVDPPPTEEEQTVYDTALAEYNTALEQYNIDKQLYFTTIANWIESCKLSNIIHDGTKKRHRYHHGLIAQELKSVMDEKQLDFGGYQDHTHIGGEEVVSLGYDEFIAPLIKSVQELNAKVELLQAKMDKLTS